MSDGIRESTRLSVGTQMSFPPYPEISDEDATERLNDETLWIRSANLEFHFRYVVLEEGETGRRFVVKEPVGDDVWFAALKWLVDTTATVDVVRVGEDQR